MRGQFLLWLAIFVLGTTRAGQAATAVTLSPASGHPSTVVTVSGTSFGPSEAVDVYVDLVDTVLLVSSSTGSFSGSITIPASAAAGQHYITAIGRKSGDTAQTAFNVGSPWSQFGDSTAHLSTNPWENLLSPSNVATLGPKWINSGGTYGASGGTVAVNFGSAYVSTESGIEAVSTSTGNVLWVYSAGGGAYASPTLSGGVVYVGTLVSETFYALNATTGAKIWSSVLGGAIYSSAAVANGIVYVGCFDGKVYALNASTGKIVWTYATGGYIQATPTVVNGVVYIGSSDHNVYALNASTGALLWTRATGGIVASTAAVANGVVYVGSDDFNVYAIIAQGAQGGALLWNYPTGGAIFSSPAVANNTVFIGSGDDNFYALNATAGTKIWSLPTASGAGSGAFANGVVYFTSGTGDNRFYAVNAANGTILVSGITYTPYLGSPSISDGVAYVSALGGNIYAFSLPPNLNTNAAPRAPVPASLHPDPRLRVTP